MPSACVEEVRVLRDVFDAFLATDNLQVFANAALDCILCLLNHVKGTRQMNTIELVFTLFSMSRAPL